MIQFILYVFIDAFMPQDPPTYVPKAGRSSAWSYFNYVYCLLEKCATMLATPISNMKARRRLRHQGHQYSGHRHRRKKRKLVPQVILTGMTTTWNSPCSPSQGTFDSDAQALMLDDGASACITNDKGDFMEPPKWVDMKVKGIKGHANATHRGTIKWHIEDDQGLVHVMIIRGAYLIPDAPTRILSPQHLAQQADDHYPRAEGTGALTTSKNITLFWAQRRYMKTVPLDTKTNVGLTTTAAGARTFRAFSASIKAPETMQPNIFMTHVIPDDEEDSDNNESFQPKDLIEQPDSDLGDRADASAQHDEIMTQGQPHTTTVDLGPITHTIPEDQEPTSLDPHDELLRWHYRLGHLSFERIRQLARLGQLPKRLLTCKKPFCTACQYGKLTKRPWRVKGDNKKSTKVATRPGQIVSVDQLESNTPGFIAQLKGKLTQQRYHYATVFVDQFSGYSFVYLQRRITSEETVQAKHAFERVAEQCGVKIAHYHADNGRFADNAFIADCNAQRQNLSYCGVNAHFQNGIAERRIRDLQEQTRTSMLYAMNKWKKMVLICLWPYAMRHANDVSNATHRKGQDDSPLERFTGVPVRPKLRHFHAFGCPTYVLDNALQSRQGVPKWKQRARLGIYLGPSPSHARTVALILNPRTGHVSPQFHMKLDDFFETVRNSPTGMDSPEPEWKYLSGFASKKGVADKAAKGTLTNLLTPRRGITSVTYDADPPSQIPDDSPTNQPPNESAMETNNDTNEHSTPLQPVEAAPPAVPEQLTNTGPTEPGARQSRSGRTMTEFRQPLQVQSHVEMPRILVQLGHTQRTQKLAPQTDPKWSPTWSLTRF